MPLDRNQVINDIKHILVEELFIDIPEEEIKEEDAFAALGLDSVGGLELVTIVEDKYHIHLEEEEDLAENSATIVAFADYIISKAS
jgi:acyl carrier protein